MKIMLITQLPPPTGGIATWSKKYVKYCVEHSIDCCVVNNAMIGDRGSDFHAKKNLFTEFKRTIRVIRDIRKKQKEENPDIVHFNTACSPTGVIRDYLCSRFIKAPIVLHCRCTIQDQLKGNKIGIWFFKRLARRSRLILVLNRFSGEYVASLTKKKAVQVANFVDDEYLRNSPKLIEEHVKSVVYTGHFQSPKGADEMLAAAEKLPEIRFVFIGQVDQAYQHKDYPPNVVFTGNQNADSVKHYLDESDVYVFPSYTEGFANSLTEAMARGLPCIVSDVGANKDMIEDKGGIVIPARDSEALYQAIKSIDSSEKRRSMSEWNIQKVKDNYLISAVIPILLDIYKKAIKESF